jgi:DNA mismatch repair protein MutL
VAETVANYAALPAGDPGPRSGAAGSGAPRTGLFPATPSPGRDQGEADTERGRTDFEASRGRLGKLRYLGAFDATYLLFEDVEGPDLVVLDQHAAHERILYEAFLARLEGARTKIQPLLFPVTLECTAAEMAAFEERATDLQALGLQVEVFGPTTLVLRSAPAVLAPGAAEAAVRDLLGGDDLPGEAGGPRERSEAAARRAACSAAVKARAALLPSEVEVLTQRLAGLRNPTHCPHGRPVLLRLSRRDLEGMFHRR